MIESVCVLVINTEEEPNNIVHNNNFALKTVVVQNINKIFEFVCLCACVRTYAREWVRACV